jgi:multicomponent Na+:H+ antiporter subunit D
MTVLLILPIVIPLASAALALVAWRSPATQRVIVVAGSAGLLGAGVALLAAVESSGVIAVTVGGWPAPFGISLVADLFSAIMVVVAGIIGLAVAVYGVATVDGRRQSFGYHPLFAILLTGVCGAFLTGDIFNLYVWFEVMLIASFVLLALGGERAQLEGALKYVALNLVSSALFLSGVGLLYGVAGTLNMADLAGKLPDVVPSGLVTAIAMLFLVAFGIKAAVFPLYFWLPASYHTPPVAVSAVFAGLLTKVGVYALIRVFTLVFSGDTVVVDTILLWVAGLTMVVGVFGAVAQHEFRRVLSFHIISQIGYMVMGLALHTPLAIAGSIFYIVHHIIVKTNLFLVSGAVARLGGTGELSRLGGLWLVRPGLGILFLIPAMSLAGIPPLSGFFAKLALVQAGLAIDQVLIVAVALAVSVLTLFSMLKIWNEAFWKPQPATVAEGTPASGVDGTPAPVHTGPAARPAERPPDLTGWLDRRITIPMIGLAACTLAIAVTAEPIFQLALRAADQLLDPTAYVAAVLEGTTR